MCLRCFAGKVAGYACDSDVVGSDQESWAGLATTASAPSPQFAQVSNYTALLSGSDWWGSTPSARSAVVTYSFDEATNGSATSFTSAFQQSFRSFTGAERDLARTALAKWANACGLVFVEVASGTGDIRFGSYNFALDPTTVNFGGFAYYPSVGITKSAGSSWFYDLAIGGDVFIDLNDVHEPTLLHEIGHALGLKHPFTGSPNLPSGMDNHTNTIMSYTGSWPNQLGALDPQAVQALYGANSADGSYLTSYGYAGGVLTQVGTGGDDTIRGHPGRDSIAGGVGADMLVGGDGDDTLAGGAGADVLLGGRNNDWLAPGAGDDEVDGAAGYYATGDESTALDTVDYSSETQAIAVNLAGVWLGGRTVHATGAGIGSDVLKNIRGVVAGSGNDTLTGDGSANVFDGGAGADLMQGGGGDDVYTVDNPGDQVIEAFGGGADLIRALIAFTLPSDVEQLIILDAAGGVAGTGNVFGNVMAGNASGNALYGLSGNDSLYGNGGADQLFGGDGADILVGGAGADTLDGGAGADTAVWSIDRTLAFVCSFESGGRFYTSVTDGTGANGTDTLVDVETLGFSNGASAFGLAGVQQNNVSNLDGGRFDDVLFRHAGTGQVAYQDMTGATPGGFKTVLGSTPAGWSAFATGDVTGDGRADVFIQNTNTGAAYYVNIASGAPSWGTVSASLLPSFQALDVGDMTRDGVVDVLFRDNASNFIYAADMNAGGVFGGWILVGNLGAAWRTVGLGDFNRDGASDVLFQETTTGLTYYRDVANGGWGFVAGGLGPNWVAREAADLTGDGYCDVVFRNAVTRDVWFVDMQGGSQSRWGVVANALGGWDVKATADVDNDGYRDVIVQNTTDGSVLYADMNAGAFAGWSSVSGALATGWVVV